MLLRGRKRSFVGRADLLPFHSPSVSAGARGKNGEASEGSGRSINLREFLCKYLCEYPYRDGLTNLPIGKTMSTDGRPTIHRSGVNVSTVRPSVGAATSRRDDLSQVQIALVADEAEGETVSPQKTGLPACERRRQPLNPSAAVTAAGSARHSSKQTRRPSQAPRAKEGSDEIANNGRLDADADLWLVWTLPLAWQSPGLARDLPCVQRAIVARDGRHRGVPAEAAQGEAHEVASAR